MERSKIFFQTFFSPIFRVGGLHKIHPSFMSHTIRLAHDPHRDPCTGVYLGATSELHIIAGHIWANNTYHISRSHIWASHLVGGHIWVTQQLHRYQSHIWALLTSRGPHLSLASSATSEPNSFDILTSSNRALQFLIQGHFCTPHLRPHLSRKLSGPQPLSTVLIGFHTFQSLKVHLSRQLVAGPLTETLVSLSFCANESKRKTCLIHASNHASLSSAYSRYPRPLNER